ncbi:MAG: hypothetical protein ACTSSP_01980 [Candidatus Asgardarchaeia archaeon]
MNAIDRNDVFQKIKEVSHKDMHIEKGLTLNQYYRKAINLTVSLIRCLEFCDVKTPTFGYFFESILSDTNMNLFVKVFSIRRLIEEDVTLDIPTHAYDILMNIAKNENEVQALRYLAIIYLYTQRMLNEDEVLSFLKDPALPWQFKEKIIERVIPRVLRIYEIKEYISDEELNLNLKMKIFLELFKKRKVCVDWSINFLKKIFEDKTIEPHIRYDAFLCLLKCEEDISKYKDLIFKKDENIVVRALLLEELDRLEKIDSNELLYLFKEEENEGLKLLSLYRYLLKGLRIPMEDLPYIYKLIFDKTIDAKMRFAVFDLILKTSPDLISDRISEFINSIDDPYERWDILLELFLVEKIDDEQFRKLSLDILSHPKRTFSLVQKIVNTLYRRGILTEDEYRASLPS